MGLNAAKGKLQQDIQKALNDAFKEAYKATFIYGGGEKEILLLKNLQRCSNASRTNC